MFFEPQTLDLLKNALEHLQEGFDDLPEHRPSFDMPSIQVVLMETASKLHDNYPYPHPMYLGQMLKPPHPVAALAYTLSMLINPNNHALDGGRASSMMEKECISKIARMFGWRDPNLGHLCGGGTMANLEALWISSCLRPSGKILASSQAHYTHARLCGVLGIPFISIPCDSSARMDMHALEQAIKDHDVAAVVATMGTTATGAVDPLSDILDLSAQRGFRIHADAAYGGFFILADNLRPQTRKDLKSLESVDSLVIDPHKHGLQPYGCGSVLFKDPSVGKFYKHDSPYTYFTSDELHLGEISLECSRPGASAVALWATQRLLPLVPGGLYARDLARSRKAALLLNGRLSEDARFFPPLHPDLDIVVWAPKADSVSTISELSLEIFRQCAAENLHIAVAKLPVSLFRDSWRGIDWDLDNVTCLRSCLMKPEHLFWIDKIWDTLDHATTKALNNFRVQ